MPVLSRLQADKRTSHFFAVFALAANSFPHRNKCRNYYCLSFQSCVQYKPIFRHRLSFRGNMYPQIFQEDNFCSFHQYAEIPRGHIFFLYWYIEFISQKQFHNTNHQSYFCFQTKRCPHFFL